MRGILFSRVMMKQDGGGEHAAIIPGLSSANAEERLFCRHPSCFSLEYACRHIPGNGSAETKPSASHRAMFYSLGIVKVVERSKKDCVASSERSVGAGGCMVSWNQPVLGRSDPMRPRSVRIGEVLLVVAVLGVGIFLVVDSWNKDAFSSNMDIGIPLIAVGVLNGIFLAIRAWRNQRSRSQS